MRNVVKKFDIFSQSARLVGKLDQPVRQGFVFFRDSMILFKLKPITFLSQAHSLHIIVGLCLGSEMGISSGYCGPILDS